MSDDGPFDKIPTDEDGNLIMPVKMQSLQLDTLEHPEYVHKDQLREFITYLRDANESFTDCTEATHANQYDEYNKNDVMRETLRWIANELEAVIDDE